MIIIHHYSYEIQVVQLIIDNRSYPRLLFKDKQLTLDMSSLDRLSLWNKNNGKSYKCNLNRSNFGHRKNDYLLTIVGNVA